MLTNPNPKLLTVFASQPHRACFKLALLVGDWQAVKHLGISKLFSRALYMLAVAWGSRCGMVSMSPSGVPEASFQVVTPGHQV